MDEIRKIPPVTRFLLAATGAVTLPCLLALANTYTFLLWWPAIIRKWQIWRLISSFFLGGSGLALIFDLFLLYRNSTDLELNHFFRRTSDYAWALIFMGVVIIATNYPLQSSVLFNPMLNSLTYLWARANPHARVSLFGLVTIPAPYLPYAYLGLDLIRGGPGLAIQSATGIVAGHAWYFVNDILPAQNGGRRILSAPQFLRNLLPDSVDPALEGQRPATGEGGSSRTTGFGTAFAPRGRGFGDGGTSSGSPAGQGNTLQGSSGGGVQGWLGRLGSAGWLTGNGNASASSVGGGAGPSREAILAAAERRLREQRASSVTGRQGARTPWTNTAPAGGTLGNRDSGATGASTGMSEAIRRSGAGSMTRGPGTFSQLQQASEKPREETASSSGGSVAEQRKPTPAEDQSAARGGQDSVKHQWGTGGNRLGS